MQHARLGIAALLVTVVAASCGTGDEKSVGTPKSTATTSTSTSTGTGSCAAKCAGATPYCGDAGECVACRTNVDCGAGMVCHKDGATVACVTGCKTDSDCAAGDTPTSCCSGACVDTQAAVADCGACGHSCAAPNAEGACVAGTCGVGHCTPGYADCNADAKDGCEADLTTDPNNCTACGKVCSVNGGTPGCSNGCIVAKCDDGLGDCDANAANGCETILATDPGHCGACGTTCPTPTHADATCQAGVCGMGKCAAGYSDCDGDAKTGCEADTGKDIANCGACGKACGPDNTCWKGVCHLSGCAAGRANCNGNADDGCEVVVASDVNNCGACGKVCANPPSGTAACVNGICGVGACLGGMLDCDGVPGNGCEADPTSDANNCSACGNACGAGKICVASACKDAPIDLMNGLVNYWRFDGSLDPSVGGLAFALGSGQPLFNSGHVGTAVGITGGARFTPASGELELNTDFTLAFWANYLVHLADDNPPFEVGGIHVSAHDAWAGKMGVYVQYDPLGSNGGGFNGVPMELVDNSGFVPANAVNQWYFVVVQRKGAALSIRINLKGSAAVDLTGKSFASGAVQAFVGSQYYNYTFGGGVDEAGWWKRALNEPELQKLYNNGVGMTLP